MLSLLWELPLMSNKNYAQLIKEIKGYLSSILYL